MAGGLLAFAGRHVRHSGGGGGAILRLGAIDACFAAIGLSRAKRSAGDERRDAQDLRRVLQFSSNLNYVWLTIGAALAGGGVILNRRRCWVMGSV